MRPLRPAVTLLAACAIAAGALSAAAPAAAEGTPGAFTLSGSGFGHGVGMSQYGAYAMALEGRDAATIVTTYFPGTSVTPVDDSADIRVNLLSQVSGARLRSEALAPDGGQVEVTVGSAVAMGGPSDLFIFRPAGAGAVQVIRRVHGADTPLGTGPTATVRGATVPSARTAIVRRATVPSDRTAIEARGETTGAAPATAAATAAVPVATTALPVRESRAPRSPTR